MAVATTVSTLTAQDIATVHRLVEPWIRACVNRDWDSLLAMCTDDIVFQQPNGPVLQGDAIRPWLDAYPIIKAMSWDIKHLEGRGDFGALRGSVRMTVVVAGQDVQFDGKYVDTIRKDANGNWRFSSITWNSNT